MPYGYSGGIPTLGGDIMTGLYGGYYGHIDHTGCPGGVFTPRYTRGYGYGGGGRRGGGGFNRSSRDWGIGVGGYYNSSHRSGGNRRGRGLGFAAGLYGSSDSLGLGSRRRGGRRTTGTGNYSRSGCNGINGLGGGYSGGLGGGGFCASGRRRGLGRNRRVLFSTPARQRSAGYGYTRYTRRTYGDEDSDDYNYDYDDGDDDDDWYDGGISMLPRGRSVNYRSSRTRLTPYHTSPPRVSGLVHTRQYGGLWDDGDDDWFDEEWDDGDDWYDDCGRGSRPGFENFWDGYFDEDRHVQRYC